jgi:nucleotide-binding universal stress UspA family protein
MNESVASRSVVVGIDGSKAAIRASLWAVDESASRDVPLRLLLAIGQGDARKAEPDATARELTTAEAAVRRVSTAIEATGRPVKIETEIAEGPAIRSLIRASTSAAMVCVGAIGLRHFQPGRMGSTAAALAISARCPVAIIRGHHDQPAQPVSRIIVEVGLSSDSDALLGAAMEEARLRNAVVQPVVCGRTASGDDERVGDGDRWARADLDRRLARWRQSYPNVSVESMAVHGSLVDYLASIRPSAGLVIIGAHNRRDLDELNGPIGSAILQDSDCSLLIVNRANL